MKPASQGLLYIATGNRHRLEAFENASASRQWVGDLPILLITDETPEWKECGVFNQVLIHPQPVQGYRDKIFALQDLPFEQTLFLDSDARLTASVEELFQAQGCADLAAVLAPVRLPAGWRDPDVPDLFTEINSGVLLWRRSRKQRSLIREWLRLYDRLQVTTGQNWDQASLRSVLWRYVQNRGFRLAVLPAEANFRTTKPWVAGRGLPVHVLHGRVPSDEIEELVNYLNGDVERFRTWEEWHRHYPNSQLRLRIGESSPYP